MNINFNKQNLYFKIILLTFILCSQSFASNKNTKEESILIYNIWDQYVHYWNKKDSEIKIGLGDSKDYVEKLENKLSLKLPLDLKQSLSIQYHFSRRGKDGLRYSWFGDLIEINFLSTNMIYEEYKICKKNIEINNAELKNVYVGNVISYNEKNWSKHWIPILTRNDVDIIVFLDLRENISNDDYGKVLAIIPYAETDKDDYHNRIAYIAESYSDFMKKSMEYIKINGELDNKYFLNLFDLPMSYWN